ncbi:MAG: B12-binding domain-containing radical SAM protein, partial [Myxococcales bacterium]|nr:B12-binding domain-containing radical SAM protein [Myxococcales bacterium]
SFIVQDYGRARDEVDCSFARDVLLLKPSIIAFSCFFWSMEHHLGLAALAKELDPAVQTVFGGPQTGSPLDGRALIEAHPAVDFVISGEADLAFPELARRLTHRESPSGVPGLVHRDHGAIRVAAAPATVTNLAEVPTAYCAESLYLADRMSALDIVPIQTLRGCRNSCAYCIYRVPRLRFFPDDRVAEELEYLCRVGVRHVRISDSHFAGTRDRALHFFDVIRKVNRETKFYIYPDPRHVDGEYLDAATAANCEPLALGLETSDPGVASRVGRKQSNREFEAAFECLEANSQSIQVDLMFGLPGQSESSFCSDVIKLRARGAHQLLFSPLMLFPGTQLDDEAAKHDLETLPSAQRFARPRTLGSDSHATMFLIAEVSALLNLLHRTEGQLLKQVEGTRKREALIRSWFERCVGPRRAETIELLLDLRGTSEHLKRWATRLAAQAIGLLTPEGEHQTASTSLLEGLARTDLLEEAMRRRHRELRSAPIPSRSPAHVWFPEDIANRRWRLDDECWMAEGRVFDCRSATVHDVDTRSSALLERLHAGAAIFDIDHPYATEDMGLAVQWIRRGVLTPEDVRGEGRAG